MDQSENPEPILNDRVLLVNGTVTQMTLSVDGLLRWSDSDCGQRCLVIEKHVLGFSSEGSKIKIRAVVEDGDGWFCFGNRGNLVRKEFVFEPLSEDSFKLWCTKLREFINLLGRPKKLFVFVNPFGGNRSASNIFINYVKPLLEDAEIDITLQETKYQRHAEEVVYSLDLSTYDGIVCVSGDGILVEVINGLLRRDDWVDAIKMPLGVVPAGTGNGMAKSLLDSVGDPCSACNATLVIIRDIDIESEKYRWMGSARLDFYGLQRMLCLRHYRGRVSFVPAPGFEDYGEQTRYDCETASVLDSCNLSDDEPISIQRNGYQGPDINLKDLNWRKIDGPFISVWLHNVPWGAENTLAAPDAKFSDGFIDLILIRDCPKLSLLSLMTELNNGRHVRSPFVIYIKVKAFILKPGSRVEEPEMEGIIDSDGEVLARGKGTFRYGQKTAMRYDKLEISMHQGLATLFSPS